MIGRSRAAIERLSQGDCILSSGETYNIRKLQLTADLLSFLLAHNYRYCLSKTTLAADADHVTITLTPTLKHPRTRNLPNAYDTYFNLKREPAQMAKGLDEDTVVWVELNTIMATAYLKDVLKPVLNSGQGIIKLHLVS